MRGGPLRVREVDASLVEDLRAELREAVFQEEEATVREEARAEIHESIRKEEYAKLVDEMAVVRERLTKNIVQEVAEAREKQASATITVQQPEQTATTKVVQRQQQQPRLPTKPRRFYGRKLQTF